MEEIKNTHEYKKNDEVWYGVNTFGGDREITHGTILDIIPESGYARIFRTDDVDDHIYVKLSDCFASEEECIEAEKLRADNDFINGVESIQEENGLTQ